MEEDELSYLILDHRPEFWIVVTRLMGDYTHCFVSESSDAAYNLRF
jgi:hypothetical protein